MNNPYIFPVCFAAAVHGALLFGFRPDPVSPRPVRTPDLHRVIFAMPHDEEPAVLEPERSDTQRKPAPPDAPPVLRRAEPVAVRVDDGITFVPPLLGELDPSHLRRMIDSSVVQVGGSGEGRWPKGLLTSDHLDSVPRTRFRAAPVYPYQAKQDGRRGEVTVEFIVDEHGQVVDPRIVSSTDRVFEEATLRAVAKWRFEPGRRDGRIVRFRMSAPFVFNLSE